MCKYRQFTQFTIRIPARGSSLQCVNVLSLFSLRLSHNHSKTHARSVRFHSPVSSWFPAVHKTLFHGSSACRQRFALSPSVALSQNLGCGTAHTVRHVSSRAEPKAPKPVVVNSGGYLHRMRRSALQNLLLRFNAERPMSKPRRSDVCCDDVHNTRAIVPKLGWTYAVRRGNKFPRREIKQ